jgi:hypothetical protein
MHSIPTCVSSKKNERDGALSEKKHAAPHQPTNAERQMQRKYFIMRRISFQALSAR